MSSTQIDPCEKIIIDQLDELSKEAIKVKIKIKELSALEKERKKNMSDLTQEEKEKLVNLSLLDTKYNDFVSSIYLQDNQGASNLSYLITALKIKKMLATKNGYLMLIDMQSGGSARTTRNIFGTKVKYSGGAVINFLFYDNKGWINFSDTLFHHTGFHKLNRGKTTSVSSPKNSF